MRYLIRPVERNQSALTIRELNFEPLDVVPVLLVDDRKGLSTQRVSRMRDAHGGCFFVCIDAVTWERNGLGMAWIV